MRTTNVLLDVLGKSKLRSGVTATPQAGRRIGKPARKAESTPTGWYDLIADKKSRITRSCLGLIIRNPCYRLVSHSGGRFPLVSRGRMQPCPEPRVTAQYTVAVNPAPAGRLQRPISQQPRRSPPAAATATGRNIPHKFDLPRQSSTPTQETCCPSLPPYLQCHTIISVDPLHIPPSWPP